MGGYMKRKGHKHKESFSLLFISNTGKAGRQFHISQFAFRALICLIVVICAAAAIMGYMVYRLYPSGGGQQDLKEQLETKEQLVVQLEAEKNSLNDEMQALKAENAELKEEIENKEAEAEAEPEPDPEDYVPIRYPSSGISSVLASYSEEQPYLSINTHVEGNIVATGDGTVTSVTSDDTCPVIIEVEHKKGYKTRYMCHQEAEVMATEGAQVEAGDTLFTITIDDTQLDYEITFEGNPIDPLTVIKAKG